MNNEKNAIRHQFTTKPSSTRLRHELAGVRERRNAAVAEATIEDQPRGSFDAPTAEGLRVGFKKIAALGAVAAFGIFGAPKVAEMIAPTATGHAYTQDELAQLPQKSYTFEPNQGIDDAIAKVDGSKDIFSDGPDLKAVEDYIAAQTPGGVAQPNETVQVPVISQEGK